MSKKLEAIIFDFDGLILDTETPEFEVLQEIYGEHNAELSIQKWGKIIGGSDAVNFDPIADLERLLGKSIDRQRVRDKWERESSRRKEANPILPGVLDLLAEADRMKIDLAVASSSSHAWVDSHLKRLGLFERFQHIVCADDVRHTKPSPELFNLALRKLNARAEHALIFEDSPNGVKAANAAGIAVVVVPNPITRQLVFQGETLRLNSLTEFSIPQWIG